MGVQGACAEESDGRERDWQDEARIGYFVAYYFDDGALDR
jgi:hypothetical protein